MAVITILTKNAFCSGWPCMARDLISLKVSKTTRVLWAIPPKTRLLVVYSYMDIIDSIIIKRIIQFEILFVIREYLLSIILIVDSKNIGSNTLFIIIENPALFSIINFWKNNIKKEKNNSFFSSESKKDGFWGAKWYNK